jgi:hypothetical protein
VDTSQAGSGHRVRIMAVNHVIALLAGQTMQFQGCAQASRGRFNGVNLETSQLRASGERSPGDRQHIRLMPAVAQPASEQKSLVLPPFPAPAEIHM